MISPFAAFDGGRHSALRERNRLLREKDMSALLEDLLGGDASGVVAGSGGSGRGGGGSGGADEGNAAARDLFRRLGGADAFLADAYRRDATQQATGDGGNVSSADAEVSFFFGADGASLSMREVIYRTFDDASFSPFARTLSYVLIVAIVLAIVTFVLETEPLFAPLLGLFGSLEGFCVVVFIADYATRCATCPSYRAFFTSWANGLDLLTIVPFFLDEVNVAFHPKDASYGAALRVLRIFRIVRIFRLTKYIPYVGLMTGALVNSLPPLAVAGITLAIGVLLLAMSAFYAERGAWDAAQGLWINADGAVAPLQDVGSALYWCIITLTTVGYGELYPITGAGKAVGALCCLMGCLLISFPVAIYTDEFAKLYTDFEKRRRLQAELGGEDLLLRILRTALRELRRPELPTFAPLGDPRAYRSLAQPRNIQMMRWARGVALPEGGAEGGDGGTERQLREERSRRWAALTPVPATAGATGGEGAGSAAAPAATQEQIFENIWVSAQAKTIAAVGLRRNEEGASTPFVVAAKAEAAAVSASEAQKAGLLSAQSSDEQLLPARQQPLDLPSADAPGSSNSATSHPRFYVPQPLPSLPTHEYDGIYRSVVSQMGGAFVDSSQVVAGELGRNAAAAGALLSSAADEQQQHATVVNAATHPSSLRHGDGRHAAALHVHFDGSASEDARKPEKAPPPTNDPLFAALMSSAKKLLSSRRARAALQRERSVSVQAESSSLQQQSRRLFDDGDDAPSAAPPTSGASNAFSPRRAAAAGPQILQPESFNYVDLGSDEEVEKALLLLLADHRRRVWAEIRSLEAKFRDDVDVEVARRWQHWMSMPADYVRDVAAPFVFRKDELQRGLRFSRNELRLGAVGDAGVAMAGGDRFLGEEGDDAVGFSPNGRRGGRGAGEGGAAASSPAALLAQGAQPDSPTSPLPSPLHGDDKIARDASFFGALFSMGNGDGESDSERLNYQARIASHYMDVLGSDANQGANMQVDARLLSAAARGGGSAGSAYNALLVAAPASIGGEKGSGGRSGSSSTGNDASSSTASLTTAQQRAPSTPVKPATYVKTPFGISKPLSPRFNI